MTDKRIQQIKTLGGSVLFECELPPDLESGLAVRYTLEKAAQERAYLGGANLSGAYLCGANLCGANLSGANLSGANLSGAYLRGAYLSDANLRGADLRGADLGGANLGGADLGGAYLGGANLRGTDLGGANLSDANLSGKKLIGDRPCIQIGPIGSRSDYLLAFITDAGVVLCAGCFEGSIEEFENACAKTHGENKHAQEYAAALILIHSHAELWAPKKEASE